MTICTESRTKTCPKCCMPMFLEYDIHGQYYDCIYCGTNDYIEAEPLPPDDYKNGYELKKQRTARRNKAIYEAYLEGVSVRDIARKHKIKSRTVRYIIRVKGERKYYGK